VSSDVTSATVLPPLVRAVPAPALTRTKASVQSAAAAVLTHLVRGADAQRSVYIVSSVARRRPSTSKNLKST
jgi:hypothetical protein